MGTNSVPVTRRRAYGGGKRDLRWDCSLPVYPLGQIAAAESPLPPDPDRRQLAGLNQPVNRPRIHFQTVQDLFGRQER